MLKLFFKVRGGYICVKIILSVETVVSESVGFAYPSVLHGFCPSMHGVAVKACPAALASRCLFWRDLMASC